MYLLKANLPWQNLNVSDKDKTKKVGEIKMKIKVEEITQGLPNEFNKYFDYVKGIFLK